MKNKMKERGITLIALVVTIIVLLVFAGVTINLALGNRGLISRTQEVASKSKEETIKEEVSLAWNGVQVDGISKGWDINQKASKLGEEISAERVYAEGNNVKVVNYKGYDVIINTTNDVLTLSESISPELKAKMAEAKANRQGYEAIGIGTDGELVDMSLWVYHAYNSSISLSGFSIGSWPEDVSSGYIGEFINGEIIGTVPQYIIPEGETEFYTVTDLSYAFRSCDGLVKAPIIPNTVTRMNYTFYCCNNLEMAPEIPNSVTELRYTFSGCRKLMTAKLPNNITELYSTFSGCESMETAPTIPNSVISLNHTFVSCYNLTTVTIPDSVISLEGTFNGCKKLTTVTIPNSVTNLRYTFCNCESMIVAPEIPNSVIDLAGAFAYCYNLTTVTIPDSVTNLGGYYDGTFSYCTSLVIAPEIPEGVTDMQNAFSYCTSLINAPNIPNSVTNMYKTFNGCSSLTTAPIIPSNVTSLYSTFSHCNSLSGDLIINANNISDYGYCLYKAATNSGCDLKISGSASSSIKNAILNTKSSNSHISLK
ncbi:MAG: leucine-rich repeat domain-containing protein [Clostridia bacterium]|nr:leucine-rich repeat domain-containing protein [Clostridia bacterium]